MDGTEQEGKKGTRALLNPCSALLGVKPLDEGLSAVFMDWLMDLNGGQRVVAEFKKNGQILYTPARKS